MSGDFARYCRTCGLLYEPDPRVYREPDIYCPRCGALLVKETEEENEE